jgi:hypothetical protein
MFSLVQKKSVQITAAIWILAIFLAYALGANALPFNRPLLEDYGIIQQLISQNFQLVLAFIFIGACYLITRKRKLPDFRAITPKRDVALKEITYLLIYGMIVLLVGNYFGISMHLNGAIYGSTKPLSSINVITWSLYNFVFFALIPYTAFCLRGNSNKALSLQSSDLTNDLLLIAVVLLIEGIPATFVFTNNIFALSAKQLVLGLPLSLILHLLGTGLPVMVFAYSILLPRYVKVSGSYVIATILGGLTYAGLHTFEYWTVYTSFSTSFMSLIFIFIQFFQPGLVKSFLTIRTGNAWVHLWGYHILVPHLLVDTPNIVTYFNIGR